MKYKRPHIPYEGKAMPNNTRYQILTQNHQPPTAEMLDGEMNYCIDSMNDLDQAIQEVVAGNIDGSDNPDNSNKVLKTDGAGNLSWVFAGEDQLAEQGVTATKIRDAAVKTAKIDNLQVTTEKINDSAVTTNKVADSAITNEKLANNAVVTAKIADGNITTAKMLDANVTTAKVANNAITADKIAVNAVTTAKIADNSISSQKIINANITNAKMAVNSVSTNTIIDGHITTAKIANSAITLNKLAPEVINKLSANNIVSNLITNAQALNFTVPTGYAGKSLICVYGGRTAGPAPSQNNQTVTLTLSRNNATLRSITVSVTEWDNRRSTGTPYFEYIFVGNINTNNDGFRVSITGTAGTVLNYLGYSAQAF